MTTTPVGLQDLRRKIYAKAKADPPGGGPGNARALAGSDGVRGYTTHWGRSTAYGCVGHPGQSPRLNRSHNPWHETGR